jgi:putative restriction endonuclease
LRERPHLDEVNFWLPSAKTRFAALDQGEPFLFKTHHPENALVGGGFFEAYVPLRVSEAWAFFGEGNGVNSMEALRSATMRYRERPPMAGEDPTIGCVILSDVTWFGDASLPAPPSFAKSIVRGKTYPVGAESVIDRACMRLLAGAAAPIGPQAPPSEEGVIGDPIGPRRLVATRLHQGAFRAVVLEAYESRCAITGHRIRPTLEAAHIKPVAAGGLHRVDNGLLLRSDIHTLFDLGYVTVDVEHHLRVSPRLREDFGNGDELYARAASPEPILIPRTERFRPARAALEWHGDEVFLAS